MIALARRTHGAYSPICHKVKIRCGVNRPLCGNVQMNLYEAIISPGPHGNMRARARSNYFRLIGSLAGTSTCIMLSRRRCNRCPLRHSRFCLRNLPRRLGQRRAFPAREYTLSFSGCRRAGQRGNDLELESANVVV